ncbi:MAG: hypothetical protein GXO39_08745 [Thermotogae bacterium]|nr:hypothetical protein [Thermotogota bacterium]
MVEFSLFYFTPPPPLFTYEFPPETSYISVGFYFAQIDNFQTPILLRDLPKNYTLPVAFKVSNGMRFYTAVMLSSEWGLYLALPSTHTSTPPLGTSALQGTPPTLLWGDIDATIPDTLLPVEVDGLAGKIPVTWRVKGKISVLPIVSSKSDFSYLPITLGLSRSLGDYTVSLEGNLSRFSGEGNWSVRYVGDRIYEDSFSLEGVRNDAYLSFQFAEENVGIYEYSFKMEPTLLYNAGFQIGKSVGNAFFGLGGEFYRSVTLSFWDSTYYDVIISLTDEWIRSDLFNNDLSAEYSADSDTVILKGSAVVGFRTSGAVRDTLNSTSIHSYSVGGGAFPFLTFRYSREGLFLNSKISGEGVFASLRGGGQYGGFFNLDLRFHAQRFSRWEAGVFYASESFVFSFRLSRAFGHLNYGYVSFEIPPISHRIYAYSFGVGFAWRMLP